MSGPPTRITPTFPDRESRIIVFRPIVRKMNGKRARCIGCIVYNFENWEDVYLDPEKGEQFDELDACDLLIEPTSPLRQPGTYVLTVEEEKNGYFLSSFADDPWADIAAAKNTYPELLPAGKALGPALAKIIGHYPEKKYLNKYGQISVVIRYPVMGFANPFREPPKPNYRIPPGGAVYVERRDLYPYPFEEKKVDPDYSSGFDDLPEEQQNTFTF